jgi:hypothetical protein
MNLEKSRFRFGSRRMKKMCPEKEITISDDLLINLRSEIEKKTGAFVKVKIVIERDRMILIAEFMISHKEKVYRIENFIYWQSLNSIYSLRDAVLDFKQDILNSILCI